MILTFFLPITYADHVVLFLLFFARIHSTSADGVVRLWDARTSQCVRERRGHTKAILDFALSPESTRVLTASDDGTSRVFDFR